MKKRDWIYLFFVLIPCVCFLVSLEFFIRERSSVSVLDRETCFSEGFREQKISPELYRELKEQETDKISWTEFLAVSMLEGGFSPEKISGGRERYLKYKKEDFLFLEECYRAIWGDIKYFPVASEDIFFENTWLKPVEYEAAEHHEGTDLAGSVRSSGYYPVISMTDGTVKRAGWHSGYGYSIVVHTPEGGDFFYAHLDSFDREYVTGEEVRAGDILGFMGNTGFGPVKTKGRMPVYLHVGIYISGPDGENISVNPYWILKIFAKKTRKYTY